MRERNKRNIVIGLLCVMVVFMSVGYAILSQNLNINGTANITGSWKIEITDISPEEINEGKSISTNIEDSKVVGSFAANLKKPTDAVIYTVTVENKGTIDAVLESITPEDYTSGDIKYTTTGKEDCKNLDAGSTCDFTIKVEYLDTGAGQVPTPNGTEVKQEFTIKYVQEGTNVNTPGGGNTGGAVDNSPAITVDSNGLVTGFNKEKLTNSEGYVVIPATTETGEKIVSIDENSFVEYNASMTYGYNETTEEELQAIVIYDEENYDEIESIIVSMFSGEDSGTGSGSGSYSSNSSILGKDINPTNLVKNNKKNILLEKLSGSGSGGSDIPPIMSKTEFDALLKEFGSTEDIQLEHDCIYINLETGEFEEVTSQIEKLDLTQATNLKIIGDRAFYESALKEIKFSDSIEEIGEYAFKETGLTSIVLPKSLKTIGEYAFKANQIEGTLTIPEGVTTIEQGVFSGNQITGTLVIPDSVTSLGASVFYNNKLSMVEFGSGLTSIPEYAFEYNQLTEGIKLSNSITTIGNGAFYNSQLTGELVIPASIAEIYSDSVNIWVNGVFQNNFITSLKFEEGSKLTRVPSKAFANNQISELTIPEGVTTIEENAFANNSIVNLSIPNSVVTLYYDAFAGENNLLTNVYINMKNIKATLPVNMGGDNLFGNIRTIENLTIGSDVETIGEGSISDGVFYASGIKKLTFEDMREKPAKITTIGQNAFVNNQISELILPESVTTIGNYAFQNNQISGEVVIPSTITYLGEGTFENNQNLTKIIIKRADSTGMTLATDWNIKNWRPTYIYYEVVYDPNYEG